MTDWMDESLNEMNERRNEWMIMQISGSNATNLMRITYEKLLSWNMR